MNVSKGEEIMTSENPAQIGSDKPEEINKDKLAKKHEAKGAAVLKNKGKRSKIMTAKLKKDKQWFEIPPEKIRYEIFLEMNTMWKEYMQELLGGEKNEDMFLQRFLKADYQGAILKVLASKSKCFEGVYGIVVQETMRTIEIVTPENKIHTLAKEDSVFLIECLSKTIKIYGSHLQLRPGDRARMKFKMKFLKELC